MKREVGKIKSLSLNEDNNNLEIVIKITDSKFKKKILRDLSLGGFIEFVGDKIIFKGENDDA